MNTMKESVDVSPQVENILSWSVNAIIVIVLPVRLGLSHASPLLFLLYAAVCGTILTVAEDRHFVSGILRRRDVRGYLLARTAIVAVAGLVPFIIGRLLA